jgi:hypothetical protein
VDNIQALYHDHGYEDVKVTSQVIDHEPDIDRLSLWKKAH